MAVPSQISSLIERFDRNRDAFLSGEYNETQVRREFLDPFFTALGWDVENRQGHAEAYKDVVHEDAIKIGTATKAPDYSFRIGGMRKFFVEAKKPSVNVREDVSPAYQLRRYAWSAKLPLSILTDFEEFAVYDCRIKPFPDDKPSTGRTLYLPYTEYESRWEEISGIFSKDSVLKGSFDKYAETNKVKKGTAEVDDEFLHEIEDWRTMLAGNIALRNPKLSQRELNFSVQRTIDRLIFLRICEDRGIETYGALMALQNGEHVYKRMSELFHRADEKYNSGLFHFQKEKERNEVPDEMTLGLAIDDKPLKDIIRSLYYPASPYEFSVLPADILGQVYEQFLGKVIRLTAGHRAVVEDKPEVKKAGGVYYTPTYIVEYIVKNTVGRLLSPTSSGFDSSNPIPAGLDKSSPNEKKASSKSLSPKQVSTLRILDPACGSGSFLIGAYQYLLDWHRDWYLNNDREKWTKGKNPTLYLASTLPSLQSSNEAKGGLPGQAGDGGGSWRLTTTERKRILLNNIYGVDIDAQAVETTKLSLLLKVLEGENEQTISLQFRMFHERALPDLGSNIKCGNSLIGPDFYDGQQLSLMEDEERLRINVFDWQREFSTIMQDGGFDALIGNPPYISVEFTMKDVTEYYLRQYRSAYGRADTFALFIERSLGLTKPRGYCGLITSNRVLTNTQLEKLRRLLLETSTVHNILTFRKAVFQAAIDTTVLILENSISPKDHRIRIWYDIGDISQKDFLENSIVQSAYLKTNGFIFNIRISESKAPTIQKIKNNAASLDTICEVRDGIILGSIKDLFLATSRKDKRYEKWLEGNEVSRYSIVWEGRYICYDKSLITEELKRKQKSAKLRAKSESDYGKLSRSGIWLRDPQVFRQEKVLTRQNAKRLIGVYDDSRYFVKNSLHSITVRDEQHGLKYILGLINSRLMDFYFQDQIGGTGEIFSQMKIAYIEKLPIRKINFSDPADKARHDKMVGLVEQMLELNKKLGAAKLDHEKNTLQRQIDATDKQIDELVYELYNVTEQERRIVENQN